MPAEAYFTPILVRVPAGSPRALWVHFGTVRYGFLVSWSLNRLGGRFVPVRFRRRRYGTPLYKRVYRTTPVLLDPYRGARAGCRATAKRGYGWSRGGTGYPIGAGPTVYGSRQ
jgi:hypothetical protein